MFIINNYFRGPGRVISRECVCVYVCAENNFLRIRHRTLSTKALCFTLCRSSVRSLVRSDIVTPQGRRNGFEMGAQASLHITLNAPIFRNGGTCPPFPPVSLPMLPLYLMNDLNNFDKNDREYSLAFTDDTVRCWRPRVKVTTGRRGQILWTTYLTNTSVFGDGRISTHADTTRRPRHDATWAGDATDYTDFGLLGGFSKSSPKWDIPCPGRWWTTVQNLSPLALFLAEKFVTVQTQKTNKQTVSDISTPCLSACVNNELLEQCG